MRILPILTLLTFLVASCPAFGCEGKTAVVVGPNKKRITICLDGRRSTCRLDSVRMGYTPEGAKDYCAGNPKLTRE